MPLNVSSIHLTETAGRIRDHFADQSHRGFLDDWTQDEPVAPLAAEVIPPQLEDRLLANEAQMEAVQENFRRLGDALRTDLGNHQYVTRSEIQKLAAQIRELAASNASLQSSAQLELKIGNWLSEWQNSVHQHLIEREKYYVSHFNSQFTRLCQAVETRLGEFENHIAAQTGHAPAPVQHDGSFSVPGQASSIAS